MSHEFIHAQLTPFRCVNYRRDVTPATANHIAVLNEHNYRPACCGVCMATGQWAPIWASEVNIERLYCVRRVVTVHQSACRSNVKYQSAIVLPKRFFQETNTDDSLKYEVT